MSGNRGHQESEPNYIWKRKALVVTEILRGHRGRHETNYIWRRKVSVITEMLQHSEKRKVRVFPLLNAPPRQEQECRWDLLYIFMSTILF